MCYSIECEPLAAYDFISDDCKGKLLDESCSAQCAPGFEYVGGSTAQELTCLNDAEFHVALQGDIPECQRKVCDSSSLQGADVQDNCEGKVYGDSCTQWCAPGYLPGNVTLTCSMYGTFTGDWLQCKRAPLNATAAAVEPVATISGFVELDVDDPVAFINDANALRSLRDSVADIAGVPADYVELTARELNSTVTSSSTTTQMTTSKSTTAPRRRLSGGNVIISFTIRVPFSDEAASAKLANGTMEGAIRSTNAEVVLTELLTGSPIFKVYAASIQDIDMARAPETSPPNPWGNPSRGNDISQGAFISGIVVFVIGCGFVSVGAGAFVYHHKTKSDNADGKDSDGNKSGEGSAGGCARVRLDQEGSVEREDAAVGSAELPTPRPCAAGAREGAKEEEEQRDSEADKREEDQDAMREAGLCVSDDYFVYDCEYDFNQPYEVHHV